MIKRIISLVLVIIISVLYFSSCGDKEKKTWYVMEYPPEYTAEYIYNNYSGCNLYYTQAASNPIGAQPNFNFWDNRHEKGNWRCSINGSKFCYFGLKDVPVDKYLAACSNSLFSNSYYMKVVKNNNLEVEELYDYTAIKAELRTSGKINHWDYREEYETVMSIVTGEKDDGIVLKELNAAAIQKHIIDKVSSEEYIDYTKPFGKDVQSYLEPIVFPYHFTLRIYFEEYEGIFWEATIKILKTRNLDGVEKVRYYIACYLPKTSYYYVYIEVTDEIKEILSEYGAKGSDDKFVDVRFDY